jgi:prepilin-type N-terminal cleavage/methylation domain-containing protein
MSLSQRNRRGFTILELLIVVAIIAVLASLGLGALRNAIQRAEVARAETQIQSINAALAMYHADLRIYPKRQQGTTPDELLRDHGPYLYAALMNKPTPGLGGGPNGPYVKGKEMSVGLVLDRMVLEAAPMGSDGETFARALNQDELTRSVLPEFQRAHGPDSAEPLVFLDPWGNPYHCRIWKGVRSTVQNQLVRAPAQRSGFELATHVSGPAPISGTVADHPHSMGEIDIWSNGPNGINEYGAGDDVRGW